MNKIMLAKALTQISTGFGIFAEAFTTLAASVVDNNETTKEEKATVASTPETDHPIPVTGAVRKEPTFGDIAVAPVSKREPVKVATKEPIPEPKVTFATSILDEAEAQSSHTSRPLAVEVPANTNGFVYVNNEKKPKTLDSILSSIGLSRSK